MGVSPGQKIFKLGRVCFSLCSGFFAMPSPKKELFTVGQDETVEDGFFHSLIVLLFLAA